MCSRLLDAEDLVIVTAHFYQFEVVEVGFRNLVKGIHQY